MNLSVICASLGRISVNLDARHLGAIGLKTLRTLSGTLSLGSQRSRWLGPALEVDHDDALGLAPAGPAPVREPASRGRGRLELEHRAERQAQQPRAADPQQVAAGEPEVPVAEVLAGESGDGNDRVTPRLEQGGAAWPAGRVSD